MPSQTAARSSLPPGSPPPDLRPLFALFSSGLYADMERSANALLTRHVNDGEVWKALGVAQQMQGKPAVRALRRATELLPFDVEVLTNLGGVLSGLGQLEDAVACYRHALKVQPDHAPALCNLGLALTALGQVDEAVAALKRALELKPDFVFAHHNLGNAFVAIKEPLLAITAYQRALALKPDFGLAHHKLGDVLQAVGQFDKAVASYRVAMTKGPASAELAFKLGTLLAEKGQMHEAVQLYRKAIHIQPALADAHGNLGNALKALGQYEDALNSYQEAIRLQPDRTQFHNNLAAALRELGHIDEAVMSQRRALDLDPLDFVARSNLLFAQTYLPNQPDSQTLCETRKFGLLAQQRARPFQSWNVTENPLKRLRIGLVSADLRCHPVGYFIQGVLAALAVDAATKIEVFVYANQHASESDLLTKSIQTCCEIWRDVEALCDEQLAWQIHDDSVDILIDLSGHTARNRLTVFSWKPAPVQATWLGFCASTGIKEMDYFVADPWIAPLGIESAFTETILRLPESFLCFTPPALDCPVTELPAFNREQITFGCFNKLAKMNDAVVALWARILLAMPESRLLLKAGPLSTEFARQAVYDRFAQHGVDKPRLILEGLSSRPDYLATYDRVDIALDPFPYPGGTTTIEGLWMGVPVVTLTGRTALSRQGESILQNMGLADWVAANEDEYLARVLLHASDLPKLNALRQQLRHRLLNSPLCDTQRFANHFENGLRGIWTRWCLRQTQTTV